MLFLARSIFVHSIDVHHFKIIVIHTYLTPLSIGSGYSVVTGASQIHSGPKFPIPDLFRTIYGTLVCIRTKSGIPDLIGPTEQEFFYWPCGMGFHWLPHTSLLTCTKTRKLYFQYHWFAAEFHCLAVGYTWLRCTKKFEGHIVPPNCSYSIIGPSLWIFSAAVGVARPQPLLPLEGVSRVSQAKAHLMLEQACLVRDVG